jgi:hypothetical protein
MRKESRAVNRRARASLAVSPGEASLLGQRTMRGIVASEQGLRDEG